MRTTIRLPDDLLRQAKAHAAADGLTLNAFIEDAVRLQVLRDEHAARRPVPVLPVATEPGWVHPWIDFDSNAAVLAAMEEGLPVDKIR